MHENEVAAHALVVQLGAAGVLARVAGAGVHWRVEVTPVGARKLVVHSFWYEREMSGLVLGMNPGNERRRLRQGYVPCKGSEYLAILHHDGARIAEGRTRTAADVVACARLWLADVALDELVRDVPFVDEKPRAMRALAERFDPQLRLDIGDQLWAYYDGRSCNIVEAGDGAFACSFFFGQAQVAFVADPQDLPAAVATWLVERVSIAHLATRVPGVELERHAAVLETDPARWHWLHVRDRIADPEDVLAPLRSLIEALAASPVVATFYSYSSLNRLCFSASSHYPWVDQGLPVLVPAADDSYLVDAIGCDRTRALQLIEATLAASPLKPFFGSAPKHELPLLSDSLARQASTLRPHLVQDGGSEFLDVTDGARRCRVSDRSVECVEAASRLHATWPSLDDATRAIRRYLEEGASLDDLAADPRAEHVLRPGPL